MDDFQTLCALLETDTWDEILTDAHTHESHVTIRINHHKQRFTPTIPFFTETGSYANVQASIDAQPDWKNVTDDILTGMSSYVGSWEQEQLNRTTDAMAYQQLMANAAGIYTFLEHNRVPATLTDTNAKTYLQQHKNAFDTLRRVPGLRKN